MWNNRFRWNQKNEQEKSQELMRIIHNSSIMRYDSIEDQADMVENFIDRLALSQNVKKEDIIEELYKRWGYIMERFIQNGCTVFINSSFSRVSGKRNKTEEKKVQSSKILIGQGENSCPII